MDEESFWALIAECRDEAKDDTELVSRVIFRHLRWLSPADVTAFALHWMRAQSLLYSWPVADAACLMLGIIEEENLDFTLDWIISFGRAAVTGAARNPNSLADLAGDVGSARATWFDEFITEAHILATGSWPPGFDPDGPDELVGEHLDLSDPAAVEQHFPRLASYRRAHPGLGPAEIR